MDKNTIQNEIIHFIAEYDKTGQLKDKWQTPLIGFADAKHPDFLKLRDLVHPEHKLPQDVIADAKTVIAYFVPFTAKLPKGNAYDGLASPEWALAYEETNAMFVKLNDYIVSLLQANGYQAAVSKEAYAFDRNEILSKWSQRHIARIAGLGTFGLNNMLITEAGCCGRISTIVTDLYIEPSKSLITENCLYKAKGTCKVCITRCPTGALSENGFDRKICFARCMENARVYTHFGNSYSTKAGEETEDSGSEVCGKCLTNLPCTARNPMKQ